MALFVLSEDIVWIILFVLFCLFSPLSPYYYYLSFFLTSFSLLIVFF